MSLAFSAPRVFVFLPAPRPGFRSPQPRVPRALTWQVRRKGRVVDVGVRPEVRPEQLRRGAGGGPGSRAAWGIFGPGYLKPPDFRAVPFSPLASLPWGGDAAAWAPVPVGERARSALAGTGKRRSYPTASGSGRPRKVVSPASWTGSARGDGGTEWGPLWLEGTAAPAPSAEPCAVMGDPVRSPWPGPGPLLCVCSALLFRGARGSPSGCSERGLGTRAAETFPGNGRRAACLIMR